MKQKRIYTSLLLAAVVYGCHAQATFTKVTDAANPIVTFTNSGAPYKGVSWIDMDGDNLTDLYTGQKYIFQNKGNGVFVQKTDLTGGVLGQIAAGSSWGDIDNDGDADCITALLVSGLQLNNGDFTFVNKAGDLPDFSDYAGWDCTLADVDNNGLLDLTYVHACCGFHPTGPFSCRLYLQSSPGVFTKMTGYEFTDQNAPYTIPVWSDYDLDGDVDLFIGAGPAGTPGPDFCYKNLSKEKGTFSLMRQTAAPFDALQDGQTYNFPDFDNDGDLDMVLTNYGGTKCRFWKNNSGVYESINTPFTTQGPFLTNTWGDLDNDGDLDVVISLDGNANIRYYENLGNGTFKTLQTLGTADMPLAGISFADYDNDGDLDGYTNGASTARALFRNDIPAGSGNWASFTLEGITSNRSAIGAIIRLKSVIDGTSRWQIREISAHNSFQGQNDLRQHFGLKDAVQVDSLEIRWPSGPVQVFAGLTNNTFYKITEGENPEVNAVTITADTGLSIQVFPNPATNIVTTKINTPGTFLFETAEIFDTTGKLWLTKMINKFTECTVPVHTLPVGSYFIRYTFNDKSRVVRKLEIVR